MKIERELKQYLYRSLKQVKERIRKIIGNRRSTILFRVLLSYLLGIDLTTTSMNLGTIRIRMTKKYKFNGKIKNR